MGPFKKSAAGRRRRVFLAWSAALAIGTVVVGAGLVAELTLLPGPVLRADPGFPALGDYDGDGIPNIADNEFQGCDPGRADNDGDGYRDGYELATGSDPYDYYSRPARSSGVRILVAPDHDQVYIVFVMASGTGFLKATGQRILFVQHDRKGPIPLGSFDVTAAVAKQVHRLTGLTGQVISWTLKVARDDIKLWALGFGMREDGNVYCDGTLVQRRSNGCIYTLRLPTDTLGQSHLEPTEPESKSGPPGTGFKECEQISYATSPGSPLRHILSESCETRDHYVCPPDCGALAGYTVIDLNNVWLY